MDKIKGTKRYILPVIESIRYRYIKYGIGNKVNNTITTMYSDRG